MLFPFYIECAKQKAVKVLNHISFFASKAGWKASDAGSRQQYWYNTRSASPIPNLIGKANGKASGTASAADKKKSSTFPSSYHHRQSRRKGSGTHALPNLRQDVSVVAALIHY